MGSFSLGHWLVVALVALLLFGPRRIGDVGKGLGEGLRNFKDGLRGLHDGDDQEPARRLADASKKDRGGDGSSPS